MRRAPAGTPFRSIRQIPFTSTNWAIAWIISIVMTRRSRRLTRPSLYIRRMLTLYLRLGVCHFHKKTYEEAVDSLREYVSLKPTDADGYYWLGRSLAALGKYD